MPISENELMWSRSLPEEVEVDRSPEPDGAEVQPSDQSTLEQPSDAAKPSAQIEAASALEAILARLEMNSLEIKLHLGTLEERLSRLEPQARERPPESASSPQPLVAAAIAEQPEPQRPAAAPEEPAGDATLSSEAKEKRWSHLIGPELDALMSMEAPAAPPQTRNDTQRLPFGRDRLAEARPSDVVRERGAGREAVAAVDRPMRLAAAMERSGEVPALADGQAIAAPKESLTGETTAGSAAIGPEPAGVAAEAAEAERQNRSGFGADRRPREAYPAAETPRVTSGVDRGAVGAPRPAVGDSQPEAYPARRMFSSFEPARSNEAPADQLAAGLPVSAPRMWRGYRVRRLVWAVVLLVLAAIPLMIWWRLSTEARDADLGDSSPISSVGAGAAVPPTGKPGAGKPVSATLHREPTRLLGGLGAGISREPAGRQRNRSEVAGVAAPVERRPPSDVGDLATTPASVTRGLGGRTSSGTAAAASGLGGPVEGNDEVPGTSGLRVRVPENVMAAHLLPTGDVGELPRGSGEVTAAIFISNTGRVEQVEVISGKQGLRQAAAHAIQNWRYEPYIQGGVRVPVVTTASIRFGGESVEAR